MDYKGYFKDKKITLMGLGLLGRGVGDAQFLVDCGVELIVTDLKSEAELKPSLEKLKDYPNITFTLGEHRLKDFENRDLVIKAAGTPLDSLYVEHAHKNNIPVEMSTALFAQLSDAILIGITGTRGKSTVTQLIYEILKKAGKSVYCGGNVLGISTLALLGEVGKKDYVILELDSWQLQGFGEDEISPHIAVFTTFMPDHMDYYQGDMIQYWNDKENIFKNQTPEDYVIFGKIIASLAKEKNSKLTGTIIIATKEDIPADWNFKLKGEHNKDNSACAIAVARILKIDEKIIKEALENFEGVPSRLEFLREYNGISIYNDTTATTQDATIAALESLGDHKNIILIAGGADKGLQMDRLLDKIPQYCKQLILLPGTGTDKLRIMNKELRIKKVKNLKEALDRAVFSAKKGDVILLSPAFPSFGLFRNEFHRGDEFVKLVNDLR